MKKKKKPDLASLASLMPANDTTFVLSETGTFQKGGFRITAAGIKEWPASRADFAGSFSSVTLDDLEIVNKIGDGASGTVRLARHKASGHLLALKAINIGGQGERHQVLNELRVLSALNHGCLVPFLDAFYLDGTVYLALAYMDGGSLDNVLACYKPIALATRLSIIGLPDNMLAHVMFQVMCALAYLHEQGVVHRDLKPCNILLDTAGSVKVADFGISKKLEETLGLAQTFVGTAAYMAPERIHGQDYSVASDVWSAGMVAIECAQGEHPYHAARSYYDLAVALSDSSPPPRLSEVFPPQLCSFVAACLTPSPLERPTSAALLRDPFLMLQYTSFGGSGGSASNEQLAGLAASRLREWVRQTFVPAAQAAGGITQAAASGWSAAASGMAVDVDELERATQSLVMTDS